MENGGRQQRSGEFAQDLPVPPLQHALPLLCGQAGPGMQLHERAVAEDDAALAVSCHQREPVAAAELVGGAIPKGAAGIYTTEVRQTRDRCPCPS
jgi:hypothetical protein